MNFTSVRLFGGALTLSLALLFGCSTPSAVKSGGDNATGELGSPTAQQGPADVYIELSAAYLRERNFTEAYMNANKAVMVDPSSSNARFMLALVHQQLGQLEEADKAYRKSISLDPRNPAALNAYGSFLCEQERYADADGYFRRALDNPLYNTPWLAWHNAGSCREIAGDLGGAESDYRSALQSNPRFAPSLLGMAEVSFEQGNYLSARAYLQRFAEVSPHTAESLWLGVRTENQLGDKDQMASYRLKLNSRFPDSHEARYLQTID
jgi:type IV pilus assembly protein PilF